MSGNLNIKLKISKSEHLSRPMTPDLPSTIDDKMNILTHNIVEEHETKTETNNEKAIEISAAQTSNQNEIIESIENFMNQNNETVISETVIHHQDALVLEESIMSSKTILTTDMQSKSEEKLEINLNSEKKESGSESPPENKPLEKRQNSLLELYDVKHVHAIEDHFKSLEEISVAIHRAGLEKSQLIFGIDFTISNLENGAKTFNGRSLHYYDETIKNPYQKVIEILGKTLEIFDLDGRIPAFGFGDSKTKDRKVFPFSV